MNSTLVIGGYGFYLDLNCKTSYNHFFNSDLGNTASTDIRR